MNNRTNTFLNATSDAINSEFFHEIYFRNKPEPLVGRSAKVGYREKKPSSANFLNYTLRLMRHKYYPGSERDIVGIFYYKTKGVEIVVKMYPEKPIWESSYLLDPDWEKTIKSTVRMYELLKGGWPTEKIHDHLMIKERVKEFFDPHDLSQKYDSPEKFLNVCKSLISSGYSHGEVNHYYRAYMEKHFPNENGALRKVFDPNDLSPKFKTQIELRDCCTRLIREGLPIDEVIQYYQSYTKKYFNKLN